MNLPSEAEFYGSLIFGAIGMGALLYGKTTVQPKKMILGAGMLAASYLLPGATLQWSIGGLLTVGLMTWKD
ncbi:MAG: hypothetical protein KDK97_08050 [Verrucomicrobiales bacterium]|nr:hypothetical protein [Verrucomicrobiales bacterium]MCP5556368.1 hypothetical protein [Verrucomicrobiaceae bacterium]